MLTFETSIFVDAPPARVWDVLTDFADYGEWNPLFVDAAGSIANGAKLRLAIRPPFGRAIRVAGRVVRTVAEREIEVKSGLPVPGLLASRAVFRIDGMDGTCRVRHEQCYEGLLVPVVGGPDGEYLRLGCYAVNLALKRRSEDPAWRAGVRARG
jgi:hypothetical protein